jgi:rubrerythrin
MFYSGGNKMVKQFKKAKVKIDICLRCGYSWIQRKKDRVVSCPNCRSRKWDIARGE